MKLWIFALAALASVAHAEDAPKPETELTFNAGLTNEYRYRGISQSRLQPAVQGGADWVHNPSGVYLGMWASTIKWTQDAGGGGDIELDLYGGKRGEIAQDVSYDIGVLTYVYPSNGLGRVPGMVNANTTEIYGQLGNGPLYAKYSYAFTNLFGISDSKGSVYIDLGANFDAGAGLTVNLHAGHQSVRRNSSASYSDWKAGITKDFGVCSVAVSLIGTNAERTAYTSAIDNKYLGKTALVALLSKTF